MVYRSEFAIEVTPDEIVHAEYWPEDYRRDRVERDHVPIKASQWADLEKITRILWPLMKEVTPYEPDEDLFADGEEIFVLDGGDYNRWYFTWKTDEGERTIQVYAPQDRVCLVLKDSFGNAFVPFLCEHYGTILVVDPRFFEGVLTDRLWAYNLTDIIFVNNVEAANSIAWPKLFMGCVGVTLP